MINALKNLDLAARRLPAVLRRLAAVGGGAAFDVGLAAAASGGRRAACRPVIK
jgi:hypothetical protein